MNHPKISIVTPSYNQANYIEETILSIISQDYPNLEYVIIDGGSTDGTVEIIKKYEDKLTYWISEKDNGQVEAINKGLKYCTGEIFNWINSDDILEKGSLHHISKIWKKGYSIAGGVKNFGNNSQIVFNHNLSTENFFNLNHKYHQPGFWFSLSRINSVGFLPDKYHFSFDRIYMSYYLTNYHKIIYTNKILVNFRIHNQAKSSSNWLYFEEELNKHYLEIINLKEFRVVKLDILESIRQLESQIIGRKISIHKIVLKKLILELLKKPYILTNRFFWGSIKKRFI